MRNYKSFAAHKVLELMDNDVSYEQALKQVLQEDTTLVRSELEEELNIYI